MPNHATMPINMLLLTTVLALLSVGAKASLVGQTVDFTFKETGFADSVESGISVLDPGVELSGSDGNQIAMDALMTTNESIDLGVDSIAFTIEGLFPVTGTTNPILNTPLDLDFSDPADEARYEISGFDQSLLALFEIDPGDAFAISANNIWSDDMMTPLSLGNELVVDNTSGIVTLFLASLHIGQIAGGPDLGTITLYVERGDVSVIPLPGALPLMLSALAVIGFITRRKQGA
ncbi:MAG TPA: hypothetical protein VKB27_17010 [Gammaproteobacteria bacterium]|nr:hypothetical protein [Gammaproteobacteria bacterium]